MNRTTKIIRYITSEPFLLGCWALILLISLNHLHPFCFYLSKIPAKFAGMLGWIIALLAIKIFAKGHERPVLAVGLFFFLLGSLIGPFLEPPADPLEHLRRIHEETCAKTVDELGHSNRGLWHYSMAGVVLCGDNESPVVPERMLLKIDIVNGMFWALGTTILFILGIQAGLAPRWAFFSVVICFLFLGTNRFSYFRYYSLAPSFTSLCLYWLWIGLFFFKRQLLDIVKGLIVAVTIVPVLWVNHSQEAVFLGLLVAVWLILICLEQNLQGESRVKNNSPSVFSGCRSGYYFCALLVVALWLLPQSTSFLHWLSRFFPRGQWPHYQYLNVTWHGLYIGGKITGFRVMDTLGYIGIATVILAVPYFYPGFFRGQHRRKWQIFVLAVLPFLVYFTPLLHFVWSSNVRAAEYYRICYSSVFWLFFADFFSCLEERFCPEDEAR